MKIMFGWVITWYPIMLDWQEMQQRYFMLPSI
jgi:hypothetical protein